MAGPLSATLFDRAQRSLVGGVNSPVRSFRSVGGRPIFAQRGEGAHLVDADGRSYVDCLMSWGAILLGHAHPAVTEAVAEAAGRGASYGLSTGAECELAEIVKDAFPSIELLRLVNSGTEAVMSTLRLARGCTGRSKVIMFEGCYHGHSDGLLVRAGSGLATFGVPASAGVPKAYAGCTLLARYNDLDSVRTIAKDHGDDLAAVIVEPVAGNMGVVLPEPGFLEGLREVCDRIGALLVFDEIITGFRLVWGGAQTLFGVRPDLTTLGKIIGGGLPVGAFGGSRRLMERLSPLGDVYQAGTLSGNPVTVAAGTAALRTLRALHPYEELDRKAGGLAVCMARAAHAVGVPLRINRVGSMFTTFFGPGPVTDFASARRADTETYARFFHSMLEAGVLMPPSQLESAFLGVAHGDAELAKIQTAAKGALEVLRTHI